MRHFAKERNAFVNILLDSTMIVNSGSCCHYIEAIKFNDIDYNKNRLNQFFLLDGERHSDA